MSSIPDVVMSKIMRVLTKLVDPPGGWWWMCTVEVWEQLVMFAGAIFCGLDLDVGSSAGSGKDEKGKAKTQQVRDDETERASVNCLKALLRPRSVHNEEATARNNLFKTRTTQSTHLFSILGQALTKLLLTSHSVNRTLQTLSFDLLDILVTAYFPSEFFPSILPGVVSAMTRMTLGGSGKAWAPGESVKRALEIMQEVIVRAIGDEVCIAKGAVRTFSRLDELDGVQIDGEKILRPSPSSSSPPGPEAATATSPFYTKRTTIWLSSTSTHLTLAIKHTLAALTSHPTATALAALSTFSYTLLSNTTQTLQELHPQLILTLLSCSTCPFSEIQLLSKNYLITLISPSRNYSPAPSHRLLQSLSTQAYQTLISLPHTIPTRSSTNLIKQANRIIAICNLSDSIPSISDGIAKLLGRGPMGGIEKWGWKFVEILRFEVPSVSVVGDGRGVTAFLEGGGRGYQGFQELNMRFVESKDAQYALDEMFRALGRAVRCARGRTRIPVEACSAVEWFVGLGRKKIRATSASADEGREVAALWCAMRLLEGLRGVELDRREKDHSVADDDVRGLKDLEKTCRWIVKVVVELWEDGDDDGDEDEPANLDTHGHEHEVAEIDNRMAVQYIKGLNPLTTLFDIQKSTSSITQHRHELKLENQIILQKILALRVLALTSLILHTPSSSSHFFLLHTLYPILTSLTSQNAYLTSTATATLAHISHSTGYASPSNLLLANFDYALDGVGRKLRLSSYRSGNGKTFDPNAIAVLKILIRLVGRDIVSRASDVVEVCFERMEEFHGYGFVVEGVVGVLEEVVEAVCESVDVGVGVGPGVGEGPDYMASFVEWYRERARGQEEGDEGGGYGPVPREDWGKGKGKGKDPDESPPADATDEHMSAHDEIPLTRTQQLTTQIISHSLNFLTHSSPTIRSRILGLLSKVCTSVGSSEDGDGTTQPLTERAVLPIIHEAWPYILKRLDEKGDAERFVVFEAVEFVACLAETRGIGEFVASRIWKDVWPRVRGVLSVEGGGKVEVKNPYPYSSEFRTYRAVLRLLNAVARGSGIQVWRNDVLWEVCLGVRRFLTDVDGELARLTRELYRTLWKNEEKDLVWLVLCGSCGTRLDPGEGEVMWEKVGFLREGIDVEKWRGEECARSIICM